MPRSPPGPLVACAPETSFARSSVQVDTGEALGVNWLTAGSWRRSAIEQGLEPLRHDSPLDPHERRFEVGHPLEGGNGLIDRDGSDALLRLDLHRKETHLPLRAHA